MVQILSDKLQIKKIEIVQGDSDVAQGVGSMGSILIYWWFSNVDWFKQTIDKVKELTVTNVKIYNCKICIIKMVRFSFLIMIEKIFYM